MTLVYSRTVGYQTVYRSILQLSHVQIPHSQRAAFRYYLQFISPLKQFVKKLIHSSEQLTTNMPYKTL